MAFSDNAIGFYLEIEDTTFSTTLARAEKSYDRYVKSLEKYNERAFKSASSALSRIEEMIEAAADLPTRTAASLRKASTALEKAIKPFTAKVNLEFTVTSERRFSKIIGKAVGDAISDVKLRLTQGKRMRTPPDFVGRLDLPRFEEGGIVKGPDKAFDSVMALLKPGEMVVPQDVVEGLRDVAGKLQDARGRFVSPRPLAETLADAANLATTLHSIKNLMDLGIANAKDIDNYNEALKQLDGRLHRIDEETANLSYTTRVRLAPALLQVKSGLKEFKVEAEDAGGVFENLFKRILSPVRFLALRTALADVSDAWQGIKEAGVGVFDSLGGEKIGDAIDNLNKMNSFLGLSRDSLRDVKNAAFEAASELGSAVSVDQLTASMADLAEQGVKDTKVMLSLAKTTSMAAEGMSVSADAANKFGFEMTQSVGLSNEQLEGMFANMGKLSDATSGFNTTAQQLFTETAADVEQMGSALRQMSQEEAENTVESFNRLGAVMHTQFIDNAGDIRQTLAKAFEGGPENVESLQKAFLLTGKTQDQLRESLKKGDITGLFDSIAERVKGLTSDQLQALSTQVGISTGDLQKFGDGVDAMNMNLEKSGTLLVSNADAAGVLQQRATDAKTTFQQWATSIGNSVSNFSLFGVKMGEVLDLTKEFNIAQLASIAYLGKVGIEAIGAGLKLAKGFGGAIGNVAGKLTGIGSAAGGVGAGGAVSSIFTGLSTGMASLAAGVTALGTVLMSPPGIALTVTFVSAILAIGGALRLASPAIKVWGDVAIAAVGGAVTAFGMLVPVLQTFIETAGTVLVAVLDSTVSAFKAMLTVDPAQLFAIGPALVSIAAGVTALAGAMTVLGAVQLGSAIMSLFTGDAADSSTGFLDRLLASIADLTISAPDQIKALTATVNNLGGFVLAYARLTETVNQLPTEGFLGGLFGGSGAADKLTEQAGPFLDALERVMDKTSALQGFGQSPRVAPVDAATIQQVVQAELSRDPKDELGAKLDTIVVLMERLVGLQEQRTTAGDRRPEPSAAALRAPRKGSTLARDLAAGDY